MGVHGSTKARLRKRHDGRNSSVKEERGRGKRKERKGKQSGGSCDAEAEIVDGEGRVIEVALRATAAVGVVEPIATA